MPFNVNLIDYIRQKVGISTRTPPFSVAAFALMNENGALSAYPDKITGILCGPTGSPIGSGFTVTAISPLTGATVTANANGNRELIYLTPAGTIATMTFVFPSDANSFLGQILQIVSTQTVTAVTVSASGLTINGTAWTALAPNVPVQFVKVAAATWLRQDAVFNTTGDTFTGATLVSPVISTGLTASGSASNDYSGSTGAFLTSTGTFTIGGATVFAANKGLTVTAGTSAFDFSGGTGVFKTSAGLNTFSGKASFKTIATPVAAAGSTHSNAAALGSGNELYISSDSAAKGVILVAGAIGDMVNVINTSATAAILYPASGGTINGLSADAGILIPASKGTLLFCSAADTWTAFDMNAHSTAA